MKNATLLLLHGTYSHDADQLKIFLHYVEDTSVDVRIINQIQFENIKGARILCIPELYGIDESQYNYILHQSGWYDECYIHGTFEGAVYGDTVNTFGRLFTFKDFNMCTGLMIGGHVHKPGCFQKYFYYCGNPYRWKFGEEEAKGFLVAREVIDYINNLKATQGIDYLKIKFKHPVEGPDKVIINNYYRTNGNINVEFLNLIEEQQARENSSNNIDNDLAFLTDDSIPTINKFVKYVNMQEGTEFITVERLNEILSESIP